MNHLCDIIKWTIQVGLSGLFIFIAGILIDYIKSSYSLYKNFIIDNEKELNDYNINILNLIIKEFHLGYRTDIIKQFDKLSWLSKKFLKFGKYKTKVNKKDINELCKYCFINTVIFKDNNNILTKIKNLTNSNFEIMNKYGNSASYYTLYPSEEEKLINLSFQDISNLPSKKDERIKIVLKLMKVDKDINNKITKKYNDSILLYFCRLLEKFKIYEKKLR